MSVWIGRVQPACPANEIDRHVIAPDLVSDDAQQMQSLGIDGIGGHHLAVRRFGQLEPAGLMFHETALQQIGEIKNSFRIQPATLISGPSLIG